MHQTNSTSGVRSRRLSCTRQDLIEGLLLAATALVGLWPTVQRKLVICRAVDIQQKLKEAEQTKK
jgi:hypothetical protein